MFTLRVLAEKAREFNTPLNFYIVDLCKAYDSVNHGALQSASTEKEVSSAREVVADTKGIA